MKLRKKKDVETDVYTLALERVNRCYDLADTVVVSFSGGKDSTAVLNLAVEVARERGKLPVPTVFWDEEAIHPETVDYAKRTFDRDDVDMRWICHPIKHRNACSRQQPWWTCWNPDEEKLWCRPKPDWALDTSDTLPLGKSFQEMNPWLYDPAVYGSTIVLTGVRADESLRRFRSVSFRAKDNYIAKSSDTKHIRLAKPIYDWRDHDVWTYPRLHGLDTNAAYTVMTQGGVSLAQQRVCPPYGEEPLQGLWQYAEFWPDLWEKMIARVPGAATAARYALSPLYGTAGTAGFNPDDPLDSIERAILLWQPPEQESIRNRMRGEIALHYDKTTEPIPTMHADKHHETLISWEWLHKLAIRGDLKGRKIKAGVSTSRKAPTPESA